MSRRRKAHDPAQAIRQAAVTAERVAEIARLQAMGATVVTDPARRIVSAYRSNVFNLLLTRKSITQNQHDAAHRLSIEWATWKGLDGKADSFGEQVDGGGGDAELVTQRMIEAGKAVSAAVSQLLAVDRKLIEAFMVATVEEDRPMAWRGIVDRTLGATVARDAQTRLVVQALESLRCVYEAPRQRRAA
jgi:hypothetical protein